MLINKRKLSALLINVSKHLYGNRPSYDSSKDYFKALGLQKTANESQIKSAYYKLALKFHPDHNKGSQGKFKQINEAYSVLSDPATKKQYQNARIFATHSGAQNPYNYGQRNQQYYQDPFQNLRNQYNQRQNSNSSYNQKYNSQWHNNQWENQWQSTQWQNSQRQQRRGYQSPYEAYERYRQQYEQVRREQMRRNKQYQQYQEYHQYRQPQDERFDERQLNQLKKSVKRAFIAGIVIALLLGLIRPTPNQVYYGDGAQPYGYRGGIPNQQYYTKSGPYAQQYPAYQQVNMDARRV